MQQPSGTEGTATGAVSGDGDGGGLRYAELGFSVSDDFPLVCEDPPVRAVTARQYWALGEAYRRCPLDHATLFPWLHASDDVNAMVFGLTNCEPPAYRGLVLVRARDGGDLTPAAAPPHDEPLEPLHPCLVGSLDEEEIIDNDAGRCWFKDHTNRREAGVSPVTLRSFHLQPSRFATISDVAVYTASPHDFQSAIDAAKRISSAQAAFREGCFRTKPKLFYNTFVLVDPFSTIERDFPSLIAVDSKGKRVRHVDFFERQREELLHLTAATEVVPNIWLGNLQESTLDYLFGSDPPETASPVDDRCIDGAYLKVTVDLSDCNPPLGGSYISRQDSGFALCDSVCTTSLSSPVPGRNWDLHIDCREGAPLPTNDEMVVARRQLAEGGVATMMCPSAITGGGSHDENDCGTCEPARMMKVVQFTLAQAEKHGHRVIIHCPDGYTESSSLALCVLMVCIARSRARKGSILLSGILQEAYLHLQNIRSFFIFENELQGLRDFEYLTIKSFSPPPAGNGDPMPRFSGASHLYSQDECVGMLPLQDCAPHVQQPGDSVPAHSPENNISAAEAWASSQSFDGSMPSRILPHLYLGSIHHARNAGLLRALGITDIVSVGEQAYLPRQGDAGVAGFNVLEIRDVSDDGRDGLLQYLDQCAEFIESCRLSNGKALVHCHVGVSRSATVVIAYCLRYPEHLAAVKKRSPGSNAVLRASGPLLHAIAQRREGRASEVAPDVNGQEAACVDAMTGAATVLADKASVSMATLAEVYLYVRARRLKVLIQPNLLFFYELLEYERRLRGVVNLPWAALAKEIGRINSRYTS